MNGKAARSPALLCTRFTPTVCLTMTSDGISRITSVATVVAGPINSLAGGGGLISFPPLSLVVPPVVEVAGTEKSALLAILRPIPRSRKSASGLASQ